MLLMKPNTCIIMGHACTLKNPLVLYKAARLLWVRIGCHICWTGHEIRDAPTNNGYKH